MLDELEPAQFEFTIDRAPNNLEAFALKSPDGLALALWLGGHAHDRCEEVAVDVRLNSSCRRAIGYDPLNGVSQQLSVTQDGTDVCLAGILVRDWPLIIRLVNQ